MRAALACLLLAGCLRSPAYVCQEDADCVGAAGAGTCESATGYCSFDDPSCGPPGRRYGDLSGPFAGQCVGGGGGGTDGGTDAPDGPANDVDGDGVPNATDNCRDVANADQGDEDTDQLGDACDPCPISASTADGDGDGVGDACDPNPATAGDVMVAFAGFAGTALPAGWQTQGGNWMVANGQVSINTGGNNTARLTIPTTSTKQTITASATVVSAAGQVNSVGVIDNHGPGSNSSIHCNVYHNQFIGTRVGVSVLDTDMIQSAQTQSYEMTNGQTYVFVEKRDGATGYTCSADRAGTAANVSGTFANAHDPRSSGLMVYSASARYQWVMIVRSP